MARRFRFRLETVRRLRQQALDQQRRVVADAVQAVGRIQERIGRFTWQLISTIDQTRGAKQAPRFDVVSVRIQQFHRGWLHRKLLEANEELAKRQTELDAQRAKLGEASKRLKVIEKLRERQWERHRKEVNREEQATYDETALQRYVRCRVHPADEVRI